MKSMVCSHSALQERVKKERGSWGPILRPIWGLKFTTYFMKQGSGGQNSVTKWRNLDSIADWDWGAMNMSERRSGKIQTLRIRFISLLGHVAGCTSVTSLECGGFEISTVSTLSRRLRQEAKTVLQNGKNWKVAILSKIRIMTWYSKEIFGLCVKAYPLSLWFPFLPHRIKVYPLKNKDWLLFNFAPLFTSGDSTLVYKCSFSSFNFSTQNY